MYVKKNNGKIYYVTAHYDVIYYILVYHRRKCNIKEIEDSYKVINEWRHDMHWHITFSRYFVKTQIQIIQLQYKTQMKIIRWIFFFIIYCFFLQIL